MIRVSVVGRAGCYINVGLRGAGLQLCSIMAGVQEDACGKSVACMKGVDAA
jgi:hypothetical protein